MAMAIHADDDIQKEDLPDNAGNAAAEGGEAIVLRYALAYRLAMLRRIRLPMRAWARVGVLKSLGCRCARWARCRTFYISIQ